MNPINSTPKQDGFFMPAESAPQQKVWMIWPERPDNWRHQSQPAQLAFTKVAEAISQTTPVTMAVSEAQFEQARAQLPAHIDVVRIDNNDAWMRDVGPSYVINQQGQSRGISWQFNAWGGELDGLYSPWDNDDAIAAKVCQIDNKDHYQAPFILEGGSIHVDGEGTVYTTEECLLHPSRNPDLSKSQIEAYLKQYLGAEKVIWLPQGLYNDETNGHIDNILHVVKPAEVVITDCNDPEDPQYPISKQAKAFLESQTDAKGRSIKVHTLPMPGPLYLTEAEAAGIAPSQGMKREAGERLAASYANYLITNKQIVFPLLDSQYDDQAQEILQNLYPDYLVTGVEAREIVLGGGNIHCITQQVPKS
ncbi:agmatine deiminase [Paraferrimonas sp. SM1919]|uniref:agmatine deiminase n=1 Tax=Paraferrimonas sp. SM1919 TaxID=2662263 RepID=UPI001969FF3B|nr:agmatine deiminase [Paraferrimonas sp. SM1919]